MKKILLLSVSTIVMLVLVGCRSATPDMAETSEALKKTLKQANSNFKSLKTMRSFGL